MSDPVTIVTDWLGLRSALIAAVEAAIPAPVLEVCGVAWEDGPRPHAGLRVLLSVVSTLFDDRDSGLDEGGNQRLESMVCPTIQVKTESSFDSGDRDALWLIEQLRLGLRKVSVCEALGAAGIVIQVFPRSTRNIGGMADERALSVHALEFTVCCTFGLVTTEDAGLIERLVAEGALTDGGVIVVPVDQSDPTPEP
jgi:hypothetical protein